MKKLTTLPNQKALYLNRHNTKGQHYVNFSIEDTYGIFDEMCAGELKVYFYLCAQVPNTYDGKSNPDCTRGLFILSPQAIKNVYPSMDIKTIQSAINKLIDKGFITEIRPNLFQFDDLPLKYRVKTTQEYEEIEHMTAEESYKLLHKEQMQNHTQKELNFNKQEELKIYDWMTEEEKEKILTEKKV